MPSHRRPADLDDGYAINARGTIDNFLPLSLSLSLSSYSSLAPPWSVKFNYARRILFELWRIEIRRALRLPFTPITYLHRNVFARVYEAYPNSPISKMLTGATN